MNWWRAHHGISNDPKLSLIAKKSNCTRSEVGWLWICLLDHASQAQQRGNCADLAPDVLSEITEIPEDKVISILTSMKSRGMILPDDTIAAWSRRQYGKDDRTNAERQRRYKEKKRSGNNASNASNAVTFVTNAPEQNRTEEKRTEQILSPIEIFSTIQERTATTNGEWPQTAAAVRRSFPQSDDVFVMKLAYACSTVAAGTGGECNDQLIAEAVAHCQAANNGHQKSAGLYLQTVPQTIKTWLTQGKTEPVEKGRSKLVQDAMDLIQHRIDRGERPL